jgi:hypothetical protein
MHDRECYQELELEDEEAMMSPKIVIFNDQRGKPIIFRDLPKIKTHLSEYVSA